MITMYLQFFHRERFLPFLAILLLLTGCAGGPQPDLQWLYADQASVRDAPPVIVIPGIMGTRLHDPKTGQEIWPGGYSNVIFGHKLDRLRLPIDRDPITRNHDPLETGNIFGKYFGRRFYTDLLFALEDVAGYDCVYPDEVTPETNCVIFTWDWRRDLVETAGKLDSLINKLRSVKKTNNRKVDLVAHSAGGLIARYYARYGDEDVLDSTDPLVTHTGAKRIRKAVLIGTPNYGSIDGLQGAIKGLPVGLTTLNPEISMTMPGLYQMLPHPDRSWMIDRSGERIELDLYDIETWKQYEWALFDPEVRARIRHRFDRKNKATNYLNQLETFTRRALRRAERFHRALSKKVQSTPTEFIVFGSACYPTPARCLIEKVDGQYRVRLKPDQIKNPPPDMDYEELMLAPGDGAVTKRSLLAHDLIGQKYYSSGDFPIEYTVFVCEKHKNLTGNVTFQDNLLNTLLVRDRAQ